MFVWGSNNNHLIKNNHKRTFSVPQRIVVNHALNFQHCLCGYDFIVMLSQDRRLFVYYQAATYLIDQNQLFSTLPSNGSSSSKMIKSIALHKETVIILCEDGEVFVAHFHPENIFEGSWKAKQLSAEDKGISRKVSNIFSSKGFLFAELSNAQIFQIQLQKVKYETSARVLNVKLSNCLAIPKNAHIKQFEVSQEHFLWLSTQGKLYRCHRNGPFKTKCFGIKQQLLKIGCSITEIYGLTADLNIVKIEFEKITSVFRGQTKFVDLSISASECFAISCDQQVWVWGRNANGQLGLSDYEPRTNPYPLITMERYFVEGIFQGSNYTLCTIDQNRRRYQLQDNSRGSFNVKVSKASVNLSVLEGRQSVQSQTSYNHRSSKSGKKESFAIQYTDSSDSQNQKSFMRSDQAEETVIVNKNSFKKIQTKAKPIRRTTKQCMRGESNKKTCSNKYCSCNQNLEGSSLRKKSASPKVKTGVSFQNKTTLSKAKSQQSVRTLTSKSKKKKPSNQSVEGSFTDQLQMQLMVQMLKEQNSMLKKHFEAKRQQLEDEISTAKRVLQLKVEENSDLFSLVAEKNVVIEDLTDKLHLLEEAIEEHERTLTARDNAAEEAYLKQKEYQLHILNLEEQNQKMLEVLNNQDKAKECEVYKKEMTRLSLQIKDKIQGEQQYYQSRILALEDKFKEERNIYEIQVANLKEQLSEQRRRASHLLGQANARQNPIQQNLSESPQRSAAQKRQESSDRFDSPTFQTVELKQKSYNNQQKGPSVYGQYYENLNSDDTINERTPEKLQLRQIKNREISQVGRKSEERQPEHSNSSLYQKSRSCKAQKSSPHRMPKNQNEKENMSDVVEKIQKQKYLISKSATKLNRMLQEESSVC